MNEDLFYNGETICVGDNQENNICFNIQSLPEPILELKENGDIFVKGKLIENDKEVVNALREFIGFVKKDINVVEDETNLHFDLEGKTKKELIKLIHDFEDLRNEFVSKIKSNDVPVLEDVE